MTLKEILLSKIDLPIPNGLEHWTADEMAECLSLSDDLYAKLWSILSEAETKTPLGGDGSNGTVEYPDARWGTSEDDKPKQFWSKLSKAEQQEIINAWEKVK